jgi:hypothetical protein
VASPHSGPCTIGLRRIHDVALLGHGTADYPNLSKLLTKMGHLRPGAHCAWPGEKKQGRVRLAVLPCSETSSLWLAHPLHGQRIDDAVPRTRRCRRAGLTGTTGLSVLRDGGLCLVAWFVKETGKVGTRSQDGQRTVNGVRGAWVRKLRITDIKDNLSPPFLQLAFLQLILCSHDFIVFA